MQLFVLTVVVVLLAPITALTSTLETSTSEHADDYGTEARSLHWIKLLWTKARGGGGDKIGAQSQKVSKLESAAANNPSLQLTIKAIKDNPKLQRIVRKFEDNSKFVEKFVDNANVRNLVKNIEHGQKLNPDSVRKLQSDIVAYKNMHYVEALGLTALILSMIVVVICYLQR
ncbi:hypothetical protein CCR75_007697 [Bremia lactucae]|uniref:RxLR effector protein n=1 Tax=Bremia lactucae TaxID=4779 RepID=A0A976FKR2_BRELC|nr:hypothetical protein CCR75_007697 [Bremia lactucae]